MADETYDQAVGKRVAAIINEHLPISVIPELIATGNFADAVERLLRAETDLLESLPKLSAYQQHAMMIALGETWARVLAQ